MSETPTPGKTGPNTRGRPYQVFKQGKPCFLVLPGSLINDGPDTVFGCSNFNPATGNLIDVGTDMNGVNQVPNKIRLMQNGVEKASATSFEVFFTYMMVVRFVGFNVVATQTYEVVNMSPVPTIFTDEGFILPPFVNRFDIPS